MRRIVSLLMGLVLAASIPLFQLGQARDAMAAAAKPAGVVADTFTPGPTKQGGRSTASGKNVRATDTKSEVVNWRGQNSKTFATNRGYETDIYSTPVHFKDAAGNWQAIDDTLVPANAPGFALKNKSSVYTAYLPSTLASPIHFTIPSGSVDFGFVAAASAKPAPNAPASAAPLGLLKNSGATATYSNVVTGVDVAFAAQPDSLKESITLLNAQAPDKFTYSLKLAPGLSAKQNTAGGIDILDAAGKPIARFKAPYMYDSSHKATGVSHSVSMTLGTGNQTITVAADSAWLSAEDRPYPVVIDPTIDTNINYYDPHDCFIQNTSPNGSFCSSQGTTTATTNPLGFDSSTVSRNLYWFGTGTSRYTVPVPNANILDAELDFTLASSASGTAVPVTVYPITQAWDDAGASWNNANTGVPWTTAGGTVGAAITTVNVGPTAGAVAIYNLTSTVQSWVKGSSTDNGFLLRATSEGTNGLLQLDNDNFGTSSTDPSRPHLRIQWNAWGGLQGWYKFVAKQLDDRMSVAVNVANGQLVVHNQDLDIHGTGLNLTVDRYYNSLSDASWHLGNGWNTNVGCDVKIDIDDHDGVAFWGPDGYQVLFRSNGSGGYVTPSGLNADLVKNGDGSFTLTYRGSNQKLNFQSGGCLQNIVDRNGNTISMSYSGSLSSVTDTQNRATTLTYGSPIDSDFISQVTDPTGRTSKYVYDTSRNLLSYTDANNSVTNYSYDANNQMSQIKDPRGNVINFAYGPAYPQPLTQISYVSAACVGGACNTNFAYNLGRGLCDATVGGAVVYTNTVVADAVGHSTTYCMDNQGRPLQTIDAKNQKQSSSYDSNNNVLSYADAANPSNPMQFAFSASGSSLTSASEPTGANSIWGYQQKSGSDPANFPDAYKDSQGNTYTYGYNSSQNLTSATNDSTGAHWNAAYNSNGTVATNSDANGNATSYTYDTAGNLIKVTYPAPLGATSYTNDGLSRVQSKTDGKGQKQTYSYDSLDRLTQVLYNGATTCSPSTGNCIQYFYDGDGNVTQLRDNTGTTNFTYDTMNRQTQKVLPGTGGTLNYTYDGASNLSSLADSGGTVGYAYDAVNELTSLTEPNTANVTTFDYNAGYKRIDSKYPNGVWECMTYDSSERLTEIKAVRPNPDCNTVSATLNRFAYSYSHNNSDTDLRWSMTDMSNAVTSYGYNALSRLTSATGPSGSFTYGYDANGNLSNYNGTAFGYNVANQITNSGYGYDANGNQTSAHGLSMAYNSKDQTASVTPSGQGLLSMNYTGATQNERVTAGSGSFVYSLLGLSSSNSTYFTRDNKQQLTEERIGAGSNYSAYYYLFDGLGSVVGLADSSGNQVNTYGYDPYGKLLSATGSVNNPWRFAGGFFDSQTGLTKFGMRFYDPTQGRWTQEDSQPAANLYLYAACNPTNRVDPSGQNPLLIVAAALILVFVSLCLGTIAYMVTGGDPTGWEADAVNTVLASCFAFSFIYVNRIQKGPFWPW